MGLHKTLLLACNFSILLSTIICLEFHSPSPQDKFLDFLNCVENFSNHGSLVTFPYIFGNPPRNINKQWNTRIRETSPMAYFIPKTTESVQTAVKCGVKAGIKLIPNSGGHSYEAISWGSNDTIIIDFRDMKKIDVQEEGRNTAAVIQPGALVGNVHAQLWIQGKYGIPMGNCLTVGMGGHAIGGGVGPLAQLYGLTLDNVLEMEMVDAKGNAVIANSVQNPELFWALRGSGPGYLGIVTQLKVKTFQADKLKITYVLKVYPVKKFAEVFKDMQEWMEWTRKNEPAAFTSCTIVHDNWTSKFPPQDLGGISIHSILVEDPNLNPGRDHFAFVQKFREIFPPGEIRETVLNISHLELVMGVGYAPIQGHPSVNVGQLNSLPFKEEEVIQWLSALEKDMSMPRYFKARSLFVKKQASDAELAELGSILNKIPNNRCWILINSETGAIQDIPWNGTAYSHRDALLDVTVHVEAPENSGNVAEAMAFMEEFYTALSSLDSGESYQNYPDLDLRNHLERYYGPNLPRLIEAKMYWDSANYFQNQISLPIVSKE